MSEIKIPQLGESVVEATVAKWVKQQGEAVQVGDALLELETEKVNVEVAAEESGVLEKVIHPAGATVKVGEVVGVIANGASNGAASAAQAAAQPAAQPAAAPAPAVPPAQAGGVEQAPTVTPVARRVAEEHGIDPNAVHGSGPGGRVTKEDVLDLVQPAAASAAAAPRLPLPSRRRRRQLRPLPPAPRRLHVRLRRLCRRRPHAPKSASRSRAGGRRSRAAWSRRSTPPRC
jgi:2-oxoglutarate dehydrogenase E2 component (dihydrolipoamide succinyltransferase)